MGDPGDLARLDPWAVHDAVLRLEKAQRVEAQGLARVTSFSMEKQAYQLGKEFPRDLNLLMRAVKSDDVPIFVRAKILEVIILRGAVNELPYAAMAYFQQSQKKYYEEKRNYQAAALSLVMQGPPELFDHLSRSRDQLPDGPSGRYPATEWMNTMLREGGLMGGFEQRQQFEKWVVELPPQQRGQAMFHLRDAVGAKEMGSVARLTGFELSVGEVGFGLSWENAKDTHWDKVGEDVLGPVSSGLDASPDQRKAFYDGYRLADRELPDPRN
jgi:hypothetical protein